MWESVERMDDLYCSALQSAAMRYNALQCVVVAVCVATRGIICCSADRIDSGLFCKNDLTQQRFFCKRWLFCKIELIQFVLFCSLFCKKLLIEFVHFCRRVLTSFDLRRTSGEGWDGCVYSFIFP